METRGFRFGLEGEYLLVEADTYRPLWHPDLSFARLNGILEGIDYRDVLDGVSLEGLELDAPHRRIMPCYVEGYGLPGEGMLPWVDLLPKGVEVRTPICDSLPTCLQVYENLYQALQRALGESGYRAVALAHHPTAWDFEGPQNHPRIDWWQWGMQAMTTYGPDLNVSRSGDWRTRWDWEAVRRRANYYAPALAAFSLTSPVARGELWRPRGRTGLSVRTYRRSLYAPSVAAHPKEQGRLEFKAFDMPADRGEFGPFFLLWLWLAFDERAPGRADEQDRVYDLAAAARFGWGAEELVGRAEEALDRAGEFLAAHDLDPAPLGRLRRRLERRRTPADDLIRQMERDPSIPGLMRFLDRIAGRPESAAPCGLGLYAQHL